MDGHYLLCMLDPRKYAFCKLTVYQSLAELLLIDDEPRKDKAERIVHCGQLYSAILQEMEERYGLQDGNLIDAHSIGYKLYHSEKDKNRNKMTDSVNERSTAYNSMVEDYPLSQCAQETYIDIELLERLIRSIERKGQAIFYGPPGTGKTFVSKKLAKHLIASSDGISDIIQFHPSYAYEDFIQGLRPQANRVGGLEYAMVPGRFKEFCEQAWKREGKCVLIIDEINRANLSRVLGELMFLLEYRSQSIPLAGGEQFQIPKNVRIIGTMNTADRSIALVDHALRRRFAFIGLYPDYNILRKFHQNGGYNPQGLISVLERLNNTINDRHYAVGISYFLNEKIRNQLEDIWQLEIEPYIEELFFDQPQKAETFSWTKVRSEIL